MSHYLSSRTDHLRTDDQRAAESHTDYAARTLGFKPRDTLAQSMGGAAAAGAAAPSGTQGATTAAAAGFAPGAPSGPQTGKVVSVTRAEVFGTTQTILRVLLDKGGERTVRVNANEGPVKVAMDIAEGDQVRLNPTGPAQWEWAKVVAVADKVRKKRKVFGPSTLLSEHGLVKLYTHFPSVRWETRPLYESRALSQIVSMYKEWAFAMWPKMSFPLLVDRIATLGNKALVREVVTDLRYGKEIDWEQMAEDADNTTVLKDGEEADPNSAAGRRKAKQVQLTANAAEIFQAFTGAKQTGIRKSKDAAANEAAAAAGITGPGLFDDDQANDDDLNDLLDALGNNGGAAGGAGAAAAAAGGLSKGAQLARDAKAALDRKKGAAASETELLLEKRIREQMDNGDDFDPLSRPVNPWEEARSKAAETAAAASARAARAAEAAAAEAAAPARRSNAKKRRHAHLDDSDDDEAEAYMAPLSAGRAAEQQPRQPESESATIDAVAAAEAQSAEAEQQQQQLLQENALMSSAVEGAAPAEQHSSSSSSAAAAASPVRAEGSVVAMTETSASLSLELVFDASQTDMPAAAAAAAAASSAAEGAASIEGAATAVDSQPLDTDEDALAAFLEQDALDEPSQQPNEAPSQQPQQEGAVPMETGDAAAAAASAEGVTQAPTQLAD